MTKDEALKLAMDFVASISPAFICEATHHKKNERHADNEPCPHVKKQKQTYEAIKKALANEALEKKAENARELGLNYELEQEYDWKDLYEKEKRKSAMWLAKYEEVAGPAPKAIPMAQPEQELCTKVECMGSNGCIGNCWNKKLPQQELVCVCGAVWEGQELVVAPSEDPPQRTWVGLTRMELIK